MGTLNSEIATSELVAVQSDIHGLNMRLQELVLQEMRGIRVNPKQRRMLQSKRDQAHRRMRKLMNINKIA